MRLKFLLIGLLLIASIHVSPQKSNAAPKEHYTSLYIGNNVDHYTEGTPTPWMKVLATAEEATVMRNDHDIQVIYFETTTLNQTASARVQEWYNAGIMLVILDAPISSFVNLLGLKTTIAESMVAPDYVLASMVYTQQTIKDTGIQSEFSTYFRSFDHLDTVIRTLLAEYHAPQNGLPDQRFAASITKPDGQGGYLNGSSWLTGSVDIYARGFTSRTPSAAYDNRVTVTGSTNCGGYWHTISSSNATNIYGSVQTVALAGSNQCPDPPATGLKNRSTSSHSIQVQSGNAWVSGTSEMTSP